MDSIEINDFHMYHFGPGGVSIQHDFYSLKSSVIANEVQHQMLNITASFPLQQLSYHANVCGLTIMTDTCVLHSQRRIQYEHTERIDDRQTSRIFSMSFRC